MAVRLSDKFNRICNLIKRGELKENDESLEDTLLDMAGYSILALKYLKEHKNE
ncbi:MAG: nucleotide modification associated domain-containing protein [Lactobacillus crispatus]|nr:nucleotide modification associated domain-containing protein [Lactobacillus crispatus]MCI1364377.1 nucleotide modification associated domain-containing protein [Lactobacillus crispatus]MCI1537395.1 nucleotide modification associated domain-containing protein [Lactobacillus crispatus]